MKALLKKKGWNGKWSGKEEVKYVRFLQSNRDDMEETQNRRKGKVFVRMSKFVRSRNSDQCRSHHQKLIKYYKDVKGIIEFYKSEVLTR